MVHVAFKPRNAIIQAIGTDRYDFKRDEQYYSIDVIGSDYNDIYIPMYLYEKINTDNLPSMPFIAFKIVAVSNDPHDIKASTRKFTAYIDMDVSFVNTNNIDVVQFKDDVRDNLHNLIRTNQETVTGVFFMNIEDERYREDFKGRQIVFHYILTIKAIYYDSC